MRQILRRRFLSVGVIAGCVMLTSCGTYLHEETLPESGATLEGTITYKNQPVRFAIVTAVGAGGIMRGSVGDDGKYRIPNAPLGPVKIGVDSTNAKGDYIAMTMSAGYNKTRPSGEVKFIDLPIKYKDPETSGITTNVEKGVVNFDIKLE